MRLRRILEADLYKYLMLGNSLITKSNWSRFFGNVGQMMENSGDPKEVADTIFTASTDNTDQLRYLVGNDAVSFQWCEKRNGG